MNSKDIQARRFDLSQLHLNVHCHTFEFKINEWIEKLPYGVDYMRKYKGEVYYKVNVRKVSNKERNTLKKVFEWLDTEFFMPMITRMDIAFDEAQHDYTEYQKLNSALMNCIIKTKSRIIGNTNNFHSTGQLTRNQERTMRFESSDGKHIIEIYNKKVQKKGETELDVRLEMRSCERAIAIEDLIAEKENRCALEWFGLLDRATTDKNWNATEKAINADIMAEYERRKDEFKTFTSFLEHRGQDIFNIDQLKALYKDKGNKTATARQNAHKFFEERKGIKIVEAEDLRAYVAKLRAAAADVGLIEKR